jgi:hypothetical protein
MSKGEVGRTVTEENEGNEARWPPFVSFATFCLKGREKPVFTVGEAELFNTGQIQYNPHVSSPQRYCEQ